MSELIFKDFQDAVQQRINQINPHSKKKFFIVDVTKDELQEMYLSSFPGSTNDIFRERGAYECSNCLQFIRHFGGAVTLNTKNEIETIWDVTVPGYFQEVADAMSNLVKSKPIKEVFVTDENTIGVEKNKEETITWWHFYHTLPASYMNTSTESCASVRGSLRESAAVFNTGLTKLKSTAFEEVLDLIAQGSLAKGDAFKSNVSNFLKEKRAYDKLKTVQEKENYCWAALGRVSEVTLRFKNSSIGTLLMNLSEDMNLEDAVGKYEFIVAGDNYKRPKALVTKQGKANAIAKIDELGLRESLARRYAVAEDMSVNDVIFVDRSTAQLMKGDVLDDLELTTPEVSKNKVLKNIKEIDIEDFIENVVPTASSIEVLVENVHEKNFVSLIAPTNPGTPSLFKWNNGFSWSYKGNYTESLKDYVKALGGKVDGVLRFSIEWFNNDDYDAHCQEPKGNTIYYGRKTNSKTSGVLDVDIMTPSNRDFKGIVENITWSEISQMDEGTYDFKIHNFSRRPSCTRAGGFIAEIECMGKIFRFEYKKDIANKQFISVAKVNFSKKDGISIVSSLPTTVEDKEIWGVKTNKFVPVTTIMRSPNYWEDEKPVLSKHTFLMLEGCANEDDSRGFYNEFLRDDLAKEKRVFEALGTKLAVPASDKQLSGLGFSSTQRNSVIVKVKGSFERTLKINI
jgi:hypothetical protein